MKNFKQLYIRQKGIEIVKETYQLARELPGTEKFGIINQITRASVSIPSNIAEGCSRNSSKENIRFSEIALGSTFELETQFIIIKELSLIDPDALINIFQMIDEEQKMIMGFIKELG
ncbi:MAG: four helix bundle protein [Bacteroidales bacterium]|nr:four helix bundle protein [Bacteroidales bacterium]